MAENMENTSVEVENEETPSTDEVKLTVSAEPIDDTPAVEEAKEEPVEDKTDDTPATEETEEEASDETTDEGESDSVLETPVDTEEDTGVVNGEDESEISAPAITKGTIIRTILLAIGVINLILTSTGNSPLPFDNEDVNMTVSVVFDVIVSVIAWWKDNDFTKKARLRKAASK